MNFYELIDILFLAHGLCKGSRGGQSLIRIQLTRAGHELSIAEDDESAPGLWVACVTAPEQTYEDGERGRQCLYFGSSLETPASAVLSLLKEMIDRCPEETAF